MYKLLWDFDYCLLIEGAGHLTVGCLGFNCIIMLVFLWCLMLYATVFLFRFALCQRVLQLLL